MKKIYLSITLFLIICSITAQDILWEKSYGGIHAEFLFDAQPTADFGFILAGSSLSDKTGNMQEKNVRDLDYWVWKMDDKGSLDWQKSFGGSGMDLLHKVLLTRDGGYLLAGSSNSMKSGHKKDNGFGLEDFWIIKLNADGSEEWQRTLGVSGSDMLKTAIETKEGGFLLSGSSSSPKKEGKTSENYGNKDYWLVKIDSKGTVEWDKSYGGTYVDEIETVTLAPENGFYAIGYSNSEDTGNKSTKGLGNGDYWILRLDNQGNSLWQKSFGGDNDDRPTAALVLQNGNLLVGGISNTKNSGTKQASNKKGTDFWVFTLDNEGGIIWEKTYDIGEYDVLSSTTENDDGTILLGGYAKSEKVGQKKTDNKGINDYVAIKIDSEGKEKWRKELGSNGDDVLRSLIETRDGGYLLSGTSNGEVSGDRNSSQGGSDFWVVKLKDKDKEDEEAASMLEAFPNPTSRYTNIYIQYEFEKGTAILYDISGRQLQNYKLTSRTLPVDLRNLPVGVYIVNIETDKGTDSVKIIKKD